MKNPSWLFLRIADIIFKVENDKVFFNRNIVRFLHKAKLFESFKTFRENYRKREYYILSIEDFIDCYIQFKRFQLLCLSKFNKLPNIIKLYFILEECFNVNTKAKDSNGNIRTKYYNLKNKLIKLSLDLLPYINNEIIDYGYKIDSSSINYPYILYFDFKYDRNCQISFHSKSKYDIKEYDDKWIGYRHDNYPINLRLLKKHILNLNSDLKLFEFSDNSLSEDSLKAYINTIHIKVENRVTKPIIQRIQLLISDFW